MDAPGQRDAVAFLTDPATHDGAAVERIDTYISTVVLAGDRAFKLKKAVRLPFLDFSTLAARRAACETEIEVNQRISPDLYLGLRPLVRGPDGRIAWGNPQTDGAAALDWVVEMRRFDTATSFDHLAESGRLDRALIEALVGRVAALHAAAPRPADGRDGIDTFSWVIDSNHDTMEEFVPAAFDARAVEALGRETHAALDRLAPLIAARARAGRLRRCHGDLHLGNVCLWQGKPTLFDAIEFSERIAWIDVFYDLAFLLMDLDQRGLGVLASQALNHYLDLTGDYDGALALPLFLSVRAAVRAHVAAAAAAGTHDEPAAAAQRARAVSLLGAARAYLSPPAPRLVAVGGLSGSGKSRLARDLAPRLGVPGAVVVRTDAIRKQLMGAGPLDRLGPDGYTPEMTERTYARLVAVCARLIEGGVPVIADAVFVRPEERAAVEAAATARGVRFDGVWLDLPEAVAAERIRVRRANLSDATPAIRARQETFDTGPIRWLRIDSSAGKDDTARAAAHALGV